MAPRKQMKQAVTENALIVVDDNVTTSPKKKKTVTAKSTVAAASKQIATLAPRQAKLAKKYAEMMFSPMKLRSREKNVVLKNNVTENNNTKSNKIIVDKQQKEKTTMDNIDEKIVEKKTRDANDDKFAMMNKKAAGKKTVKVKRPRVKASIKKQKDEDIENGAGDFENDTVNEENPLRKTARRGKIVTDDENVAPTKVRSVKKLRKRKNAETEVIAETGDNPEKKNDAELTVANKISRERAKKTVKETIKERLKKNLPKEELALLKEIEIEKQNDQNTVIKEDKSKTNIKNLKKRNTKKTIPKGKHNVEMIEKNNDIQAKEAINYEVKENEEVNIEQITGFKQKKKNTRKTNITMNKKTETNKKQKKEQTIATSMNEEKETKHIVVEDGLTEIRNLALESLDEYDTKNISLGNVSQEKNNEAENITETIEDIQIKSESCDLERSATFLCFK